MDMMTPAAVLAFWFEEHSSQDWFGGRPDFDALVALRFGQTLAAAARCELFRWRATLDGRLAEILVLDQFSRQVYRGDPRAFASDGIALALAQEVVAAGADAELPMPHRQFLYMPYMHAESLIIQDEGLRHFASLANDDLLHFAREHRATIARFGRFPKRNACLGRATTAEEAAYLAEVADRMF